MLVNQAFRYELKPNNKQIGLLIKHCGVARFAWNWALAERKELYKTKEGKERFTSAITQHKELNALKKTEFPWMYEVSKCAPQEALRDLDKAYTNFFDYIKKRKKLPQAQKKSIRKVGLPKFKKKGKHDSFTLTGAIKVKNNIIQLPRIGDIRTKESTAKFNGRITNATISKEADRWYCSLCVETDRPEPKQVIGDIVGIDLGINCFATISNGKEITQINSPKPLRKYLKKLKRLSKQHSKKKNGSRNKKKSALRLARLHKRIRDTRRDFLAQTTSELAKTKSVICIEDLNVRGMQNKKRHLGRSIGDEGWGKSGTMLEYKTKWYGSKLIKISRFEPSSKRCNHCGFINKELKLSDRTWVCLNCGAINERDPNAAHNIRDKGIELLDTDSLSELQACGVDVRLSNGKQLTMKQEVSPFVINDKTYGTATAKVGFRYFFE
jgi:putative transposase